MYVKKKAPPKKSETKSGKLIEHRSRQNPKREEITKDNRKKKNAKKDECGKETGGKIRKLTKQETTIIIGKKIRRNREEGLVF